MKTRATQPDFSSENPRREKTGETKLGEQQTGEQQTRATNTKRAAQQQPKKQNPGDEQKRAGNNTGETKRPKQTGRDKTRLNKNNRQNKTL